MREALKQYSNWPTYPQLYVNGELIGGSDIIIEMYKSGELQKLVAARSRRSPGGEANRKGLDREIRERGFDAAIAVVQTEDFRPRL